MDPRDSRSLGIPDRILRSLDPSSGKSDQDRKNRLARREKFFQGIKIIQDLPQDALFPNFGPLPDQEYQGYPIITLEEEEINQFVEKIIRGIVYIADKTFINETYDIKPLVVDDQKAVELRELVDSTGKIFDRKPGLLVKQSLVENESVGGIYLIEIWERFRMYGVVAPKNLTAILFDA